MLWREWGNKAIITWEFPSLAHTREQEIEAAETGRAAQWQERRKEKLSSEDSLAK